MEEDLRYIIALMGMKGVGSTITRHLISEFGSAKAIFDADAELLYNMNSIGASILSQRGSYELMKKADSEIEFMQTHNVCALIYGQKGYPSRLLECPDAPAILFFLGSANLDNQHIISIVGTRSATQYGIENTRDLVEGIKENIPNALIISGLALGIDVTSHKAALENGLPTVGVIAHGLDRIYPYNHRSIAKQMILEGGGLLTEYPIDTDPERGNFLARNRIIAGLADATIIIESKEKGGAMVTASIASSYNRDVFAYPGRTSDIRSLGCNNLIRQNRAGLITCAKDFLEAMNWLPQDTNKTRQECIHFEENNSSVLGNQILEALITNGDMRIPQIAEAINNYDISSLTEELLTLEMDCKIRVCPGGVYQVR